MRRIFRTWWFGVLVSVTLGLTVVLLGVGALSRGDLHYPNYWGGAVFAPFAIAIGVAFAVVGSWKWRSIVASEPKPKVKLTRKARRDAERAKRVKFPIDTYKKW